MSGVVDSKDIILAFFGLFLSIVFSKGLFDRIVLFTYELAHSIIPFGYDFKIEDNEPFTVEKTDALHAFNLKRSRSLENIKKSIICNSSVAMTILVVAVTTASFKAIGANIQNIDVIWGLVVTILFVYPSYFFWAAFCDRDFWRNLPVMSGSKFNILLSIEALILVFYATLNVRGAFEYWIFYVGSILIILVSLRISRIPHINITHKRAQEFRDSEEYYLKDIGKETAIVMLVFLAISLVHFFVYSAIAQSYIGQLVERHPVRSFLLVFALPFLVFSVRFFFEVGAAAIRRFLFYTPKKPMPMANR